jgi:hypothetical protein
VQHSEFNNSRTEGAHFLQIWIMPAESGGEPGYEQKAFADAEKRGRLRQIVSPDGREGSVRIRQQAFVYAVSSTRRIRGARDRRRRLATRTCEGARSRSTASTCRPATRCCSSWKGGCASQWQGCGDPGLRPAALNRCEKAPGIPAWMLARARKVAGEGLMPQVTPTNYMRTRVTKGEGSDLGQEGHLALRRNVRSKP